MRRATCRLAHAKRYVYEILSWDALEGIENTDKKAIEFQWAVGKLVAVLKRGGSEPRYQTILGESATAYKRNGAVELSAFVQAVDAWASLPSEIFLFSMLGQYLAHLTKLDVGALHLTVGRLHSCGAYARLCRMVAWGDDDATSDGRMGPYVDALALVRDLKT